MNLHVELIAHRGRHCSGIKKKQFMPKKNHATRGTKFWHERADGRQCSKDIAYKDIGVLTAHGKARNTLLLQNKHGFEINQTHKHHCKILCLKRHSKLVFCTEWSMRLERCNAKKIRRKGPR